MTTLLRLPAVMERTGLSKPTIYHRIGRGLFPRPAKNGERISVWPEAEIEAVTKACVAGMGEDEMRTFVAGLVSERRSKLLA